MRYVIACVLLCAASELAYAWGDKGHETIALIAWHYLSPAKRAQIETLLQNDTSGLAATDFASQSTWADAYRDSDRHTTRTRYEQTRRWHYVNLKLAQPDFARACFDSAPLKRKQSASDGPAKACLVDKVAQFTVELKSSKTSTTERLRALQFLMHLVGDLHQPLHASDNDDNGGNDVAVSAQGFKRGTLHGYWDNAVLARLGRKPETIARKLVAQIDETELKRWQRGTPRDWALETFAIARAIAYANLPTADATGVHRLDDAYAAAAKDAAAQQLMKAGVRLALLLEQPDGLK